MLSAATSVPWFLQRDNDLFAIRCQGQDGSISCCIGIIWHPKQLMGFVFACVMLYGEEGLK